MSILKFVGTFVAGAALATAITVKKTAADSEIEYLRGCITVASLLGMAEFSSYSPEEKTILVTACQGFATSGASPTASDIKEAVEAANGS